jgi:hypothetical protein
MKLKHSCIAAGILILFFITAVHAQQSVSLMQVKMNSRTANKGKYTQEAADIWYQQKDGKMISSFADPKMIIITNNKGEATLYDVAKNTVASRQNGAYSTQGSYFYFFLSNKASDLGLKEMGFHLNDTKFDQQRVITSWTPPMQLSTMLLRVELVLENYHPIYMAYYDIKNKIIRKVFYYKYQTFAGQVALPLAVTEINYFDADSAVTKTTYSDVLINEQVTDLTYLNFKIPADAKKLDN